MGSIVSPQNSYVEVPVPQNVTILRDGALKRFLRQKVKSGGPNLMIGVFI